MVVEWLLAQTAAVTGIDMSVRVPWIIVDQDQAQSQALLDVFAGSDPYLVWCAFTRSVPWVSG